MTTTQTAKHTPRALTLERPYNEKGTMDMASGHTSTELHINGTSVGVLIDFEEGPHGDRAKRLVACWNACEGINPDAVPDLLAACKAMLNTPAMNADEMDPIEIEAVELARAAIRKAEGRE